MFFGTWTNEPCAGTGKLPPDDLRAACRFPLSLWNRATVAISQWRVSSAQIHRGTKRRARSTRRFRSQRRRCTTASSAGRASPSQMLVPDASLERFVGELAALVDRVDPLLVMMSVKRFLGRQRSWPCRDRGACSRWISRTSAAARFLSEFDALVLDTGAPNVAKDSIAGTDRGDGPAALRVLSSAPRGVRSGAPCIDPALPAARAVMKDPRGSRTSAGTPSW
ncbi:MAG: hypothetical protein IPI27_18370 [Betaproteobacteria bacterium]|nr:hypothetical protein [Betaproteobacteria bacterium]